MNKSLLTNLAAIALIVIGYFIVPQYRFVYTTGVFAFSGAITNWLAIHMLFERVPLLYGSGVIPRNFDKFTDSLRSLIMGQFFTPQYLSNFLENNANSWLPGIDHALEALDYDLLFNKLVEAIGQSKLGPMLSMVGGIGALEPLREPVKEKMRQFLFDFLESEDFQKKLQAALKQQHFSDKLYHNIDNLVCQRLQELTPEMVKEIVQAMIKQHLGWLVVWGGFFGGLIGLLYSFI